MRRHLSTAFRCLVSYGFLVLGLGSMMVLARSMDQATDWHFGPWASPEFPEKKAPRVVIDAGHGGHDGGAVAQGLTEKLLTLDLAERLRSRLLKAGLEVIMTRTDDTFISLRERSDIPAKHDADAFVSLHLNTSSGAKDASGIETYYAIHRSLEARRSLGALWPSGQEEGREDHRSLYLAQCLQSALCRETKAEDRGVRERRYAVVAHTPCPSALVECGFLTSMEESQQLRQPAYRDRVADGIAEGLLTFVRSQRALPQRGVVATASTGAASAESSEVVEE